jgi:hypothetical protein
VNAEELLRHNPNQARGLLWLHRSVCAERWQNCLHLFAEGFPSVPRELAGAGMRATLVRRHGEHAIPFSGFRKAIGEQIFQPR